VLLSRPSIWIPTREHGTQGWSRHLTRSYTKRANQNTAQSGAFIFFRDPNQRQLIRGLKIYLLELYFENSLHNGHGNFRFRKKRTSGTIAKWTPFQNDPAGRELLTLIAIGLGGEKYLNALPLPKAVAKNPHRPLRVAHVLARHHPLDILNRGITVLGSGVDVDAGGHVVFL